MNRKLLIVKQQDYKKSIMLWMVHTGNKWHLLLNWKWDLIVSRPELLISTKEVTCRTYNHIYLYLTYDPFREIQFCKIRFEESLIVKGAIQNYISFSNIIFVTCHALSYQWKILGKLLACHHFSVKYPTQNTFYLSYNLVKIGAYTLTLSAE